MTFGYQIAANFTRLHSNPPIWHDFHLHDFRVVIALESPCSSGDLYGVDMIEAERLLAQMVAAIPEAVNHHPMMPYGTTEQICLYFAEIKFPDPQIRVLSVSVSETPERITLLNLEQFS